MKKIFTLVASTCLSVMLASAAAPTVGLTMDGNTGAGVTLLGTSSKTELITPTALTVEAWVNYTTTDGGYIVCNEDNDPDGGWVLRLEGRKLDFSIGATGVGWVHCTNIVEPELGTWYHVAGVYDFDATAGTGQLRLYIDGVLATTTDFSAPIVASERDLVIGEGTAFTPRALRGQVADIRIWSVVRTEAQILASKDSYLVGNEEGLFINWKLNEGTGTEAVDSKSAINMILPEIGVSWFGEPAGVKNAVAANVDVLVKGQSLSVVNNSESAIKFTLVNLAGVKVLDAAVKAGETFAKETGLSGVFVLKGVAQDGATIIKKVVLN